MGSMPVVLQIAPAFPPPRHDIENPHLRPAATPPIIDYGDFTKCAICLEELVYHHHVWRLQCGHIFHAQCGNCVAHARVDRQLEGAPGEAPFAICRGAGLVAAEYHYALAGDQTAAGRRGEILCGASELGDLRGEP
eukprot:8696155-Pyramimonas_sp.AAC.1